MVNIPNQNQIDADNALGLQHTNIDAQSFKNDDRTEIAKAFCIDFCCSYFEHFYGVGWNLTKNIKVFKK